MFSSTKKANLPNIPSTTPKQLSGTNTKLILLSFALVIFITLIGFTIYAVMNTKKNASWPSDVNNCPDYWDEKQLEVVNIDDQGNEVTQQVNACVNTKLIGSCVNNPEYGLYYNMDTMGWENSDNNYYKFDAGDIADQSKCKWAKSCDLTWDGITNKSNIC